ncbi:hypothetical protein M3C81_000605 [Micrococcus luteus]|nr:hypothetical protein [Micrococcus luteus]
MTVSIDLAREGFRRAPSHDEKVIEAGLLLKRAEAGNITAIATLKEAFSTSDFPVLLGQGLQATAITAYKDTPKEFEDVVFDTTVPDFNRRRLVDLWGADEFERVREGEEYKGSSKQTTDLEHGLGKYGKVAKVTWELFLDRRFSDIADFPRDLAQGAIKTQNSAVADLLVKNGAWNADFFKSVSNLPLTADNLQKAINELAIRENHRDELVDVSSLYLVHGPALRSQVQALLVHLEKVEITDTSGTKTVKQVQDNPFRNVVKPLESRSVGKRLGTGSGTAWALIQGKGSDLPSIIRTSLAGHPEVDIRVENAQGQSLGGGALSPQDGSFKDDTISYRGRSVLGVDAGFTPGVWASKGA